MIVDVLGTIAYAVATFMIFSLFAFFIAMVVAIFFANHDDDDNSNTRS